MKIKSILIFIPLVITMVGCSSTPESVTPSAIPSDTPTLAFALPTSVPTISPTINAIPSMVPSASHSPSTQQIILDRAFLVISALKNKDMTTLSQYVHPQMGLRFSPYATVKDADQVFSPAKVAGLMDDPTVYMWGNFDGSGQPISLTFADYYAKFVYDEDFADPPQLALNHRLGTGNSIDNSLEFYPGSMVVEFYFPGFDPQYAGMDWRSLRLVFMQQGNDWYLTGITHDQWTI